MPAMMATAPPMMPTMGHGTPAEVSLSSFTVSAEMSAFSVGVVLLVCVVMGLVSVTVVEVCVVGVLAFVVAEVVGFAPETFVVVGLGAR